MNGVKNEKEEKKPLISEDKNGPPSNTEKNVNGSKRLLTVEPAMATYMVAVTAANPISQQYIYARFAEDYNYTASDGNISQCDTTESAQAADPVGQQVQAMASMWSILLIASDLLPSLVTTVILGAYSDRAGRKKAMIPTIVGLTIKCIFTLMVVTFRLPLPLMIVGTTIDGCLGGTFTMMMASLAYIADVTSLKQRPLRILAVEIFSGLGQTAASIGAGYLIKALGFTYPYLVILGIDLFTLLYVLFWMKETVPKNPDAKLCSCSNFQKGIEVISKKTPDKRRWKLVASLFTFFLISMMDFGAVEIITFYVLNPPLCWNSVLIGYYNSFAYIVQTIGSLLFLKLFHRCLKEYGLVIISCLSGIGFYLLLAQSTTTLMVFMAPVAGLVFKLAPPMIRAFTSKLVQKDEQGSLFAVICLMNILAVVSGNFLYNGLYAATYNTLRGLVFYIGALLYIIPIIGSIVIILALKRGEKPKYGLIREE